MRCERCGRREAIGMTSISFVAENGLQAKWTERLCGDCFDADRAESDAQEREAQARLADGSTFAQLRTELTDVEQSGDVEALARTAEFIDLLVANRDVQIPDDLRAFADRHRGPGP